MLKISTYKFNDGTPSVFKNEEYGTNWPIVYILYNKKEAYIGETIDGSSRLSQHLKNEDRRKLKTVNLISDYNFNKSVVLDLEAFLIKYMSADNKFKLQNGNGGIRNHNYYQREMYEIEFKKIWYKLRNLGLVENDLQVIENTDLFKFSPYKSLTLEQYAVVNDILSILAADIVNKRSSLFMVYGGGGTGKTILGIYILMLLKQLKNVEQIKNEVDELDQPLLELLKIATVTTNLKIGLVIPTENLRKSIKSVFKSVKGLSASMVLTPSAVAKSKEIYDLLIVDESQRLRRSKNLYKAYYKLFKINNENLKLSNEGTELDWILLKSKHHIFFYGDRQTIKPTDVRKEDFDKLKLRDDYHPFHLKVQMRCLLGGNEYVDYINRIFSKTPPQKKINFEKYDLKIYDNVNDMIEDIKEKNKEFGLCRNVAGYAWPWKTQKVTIPLDITIKEFKKMIDDGIYDIEIDGYKYMWNSRRFGWINIPNAINEIGCVHTVHGFDLNYTGVIIGNELKYDLKNNKFIVDRNNYYDIKGRDSTTDDELLEYILDIYNILCTRGMLGTYIYVCDKNLKTYLKKYIN